MQVTGRSALCKLLFPVLVFLFSAAGIFAQEYPDPRVHSLLINGIYATGQQDYAKAEAVFDSLENEFPELPLGKIYKAALMIQKAEDYGLNIDEDRVEDLLDEAKDMADDLIDENDTIWNTYFRALAEGHKAYLSQKDGDYFGAVTEGYDAVSYFERCLEFDDKFYEAYSAIGTYKYWISKKTEFLQWLPFVSDDSKKGLKYLEFAVDSSVYNKYTAANSLVWAYLNEDKKDKAEALALRVLEVFPESRQFNRVIANISVRHEEYEKAINIYGKVLESYEAADCDCIIPKIEIKHKIAMRYEDSDNCEKAAELCREILEYKVPENLESKAEDRLERVKKLLKRCSKEK